MSKSKDGVDVSNKDLGGCVVTIWALFVTTPIWLVLMFAMMQASDMPTWAWVLYWVYLPSTIFGSIVAGVVRQMSSD